MGAAIGFEGQFHFPSPFRDVVGEGQRSIFQRGFHRDALQHPRAGERRFLRRAERGGEQQTGEQQREFSFHGIPSLNAFQAKICAFIFNILIKFVSFINCLY